MFMGFMKLGVSIMALFFAIIFLSSWLGIGSLLYILPVLWFYAFFDSINKRYSSDEAFSQFEDHYLFSLNSLTDKHPSLSKHGSLIAGILAVVFGVFILFKNALNTLESFLPNQYYKISLLLSYAPQIIISVAIIALGIWLIVGKKKENDDNV